MAESIKILSRFSQDAIDLAIKTTFSAEQQDSYEKLTKQLTQTLGEKEKSQTKTSKQPTDSELFKMYVVPCIIENISRFEKDELSGKSLNICLSIPDIVDDMNLLQLKEAHCKIVKEENQLELYGLIIRFIRGCIYHKMYIMCEDENRNFRELLRELGTPYPTAVRFMAYCTIINKFPRLIVCGLNFSQICKYKNQLTNYLLKTDISLGDQLSAELNVYAGGKLVAIKYIDVTIPKAMVPVSINSNFTDKLVNIKTDIKPVREKMVEITEEMDIEENYITQF